jgi:lipoprotein-releasing system ATP-binding protein
MLSARNIYKRYGSVEVLKGVDVTIEKGEIVSIVGPSGSGKSTLLHIMGTLDKPDMGEVTLGSTQMTGLQGDSLANFRNKHIGFVFQFHHLLPEFSAVENVCIPGWLHRRNRQEVKEKAMHLLNAPWIGRTAGKQARPAFRR